MGTSASSKTTIELNGKLYDARTGKVIDSAAPHAAQQKSPMPAKGTILDGFVRRAPAHKPAELVAAAQPAVSKPSVARTAPAHVKAKLQRSKTLMRPAVKKPSALKANADHSKQAHFKKENSGRVIRAAAVPKSDHIQRFSPNPLSGIVKKQASLPVAVHSHSVTNQISNQVAHLATSTEAQVKQSVDIIEESLRNASAHLERFEDRVAKNSVLERFGFKNKFANVASLSVAVLMLTGFFAYQNAPNIEMRLASAKSGVAAAHMPGYKPAGFSAQRGVKSEPGKVTASFRSNTDDKNFTVSQQSSNWSSDSLLANHVLASKQSYQTFQDEGKTVFIYDNSNATWVSGGVWYRIDGNASLTSDQLLRIANSF